MHSEPMNAQMAILLLIEAGAGVVVLASVGVSESGGGHEWSL